MSAERRQQTVRSPRAPSGAANEAAAGAPGAPGACPACGSALAPDARFCSACGSAAASAPPTGGGPAASAPQESPEAVLAEANLLRMRGQWAPAEERCVEVMRRNPSNVHAYSLLGDIYRDQNRLEEAGQWYQLALDLDPGSGADRAKLRQVEDELGKQAVRAVLPKRAPGPDALPHDTLGTQKLAGLEPAAWLKLMWAAVVVFAIVVLILAVAAKRRQAPKPLGGTLPGSAASVPTAAPANTPAPAGPSSAGPRPRSTFNPLGLPAHPAPHETGSAPPSGTAARPPGAPAAPGAPNLPGGEESELEGTLEAAIRRQGALSTSTTIAGITVDPRDRHVTLALTVRPEAGTSADSVRDLIVRDAFRAARAIFATDGAVPYVTALARLGTSPEGPQPYFAGDVDRRAAQGLSDNAMASQLLGAFTSIWWNSDAQQQDPALSGGAGQADNGR